MFINTTTSTTSTTTTTTNTNNNYNKNPGWQKKILEEEEADVPLRSWTIMQFSGFECCCLTEAVVH